MSQSIMSPVVRVSLDGAIMAGWSDDNSQQYFLNSFEYLNLGCDNVEHFHSRL